jgi:hypothetical protein
VLLEITYEKMMYTALLLRPREQDENSVSEEAFQHFPLLLTRMPVVLRDTLVDFLSTTFDARISKLYLGKEFLTDALENYIAQCSIGKDGETHSSRVLMAILKDVRVVVGVEGVQALSSVDLNISMADVPRMVETGKRIVGDDRGKAVPFNAALRKYVNGHLAFEMESEKVRILKIACGAFVLGVDGKVKLTEPVQGNDVWNRATSNLLSELILVAKGGAVAGDTAS